LFSFQLGPKLKCTARSPRPGSQDTRTEGNPTALNERREWIAIPFDERFG